MKTFIMEYRVIGYSLANAFSINPKSGKRTFFVNSDQIGTEDIELVIEAANSEDNTPSGYRLFSVRDGEVFRLVEEKEE